MAGTAGAAVDERRGTAVTRPRVIVAGDSPLLLQGVVAALSEAGDWEVAPGERDQPADAWVLLEDGITVLGHPHEALGPANAPSALLSADASPARLRAAVAAVLEGLFVREQAWATPATDGPPHEPLTARELEVFELLGKGLSNRDIGGVLGISAHTAKYHVAQILAKVGAATRAEAVREGLRSGLIGL
jgi:DNA-binding CsgD family transcriptional regulator